MLGFTKTKFGILIATAIFFALLLFTELSPIGDFLTKDGITRDDVAKYRIHILSTPELNKVNSKDTSLNITAELNQLGNSNYFRASGGDDFFAYFKLGNKWDFDKLEPHQLKQQYNQLKPIYSLKYLDGTLFLQKLDQNFRAIELRDSKIDNPKITVFNNNKSAILTWVNDNTQVISLLKDITSSPLEYLNFQGYVEDLVLDKFGKRVYAITLEDKSSNNASISYVEASNSSVEPAKLDTVLSNVSKVGYSSLANTICILDKTRLRILNAQTGASKNILYLKNLFSNSDKIKDGTKLNFKVLDKVPAAFLEDHLIDLRDGSIVDILPGLSEKSIYTIDYANKNLYYSPVENDDSISMNIATYDLHNLRLTQQIKLGSKNSQESDRNERNDYLKLIFLDKNQNLVGLSAPKE